MPIDKNGIIIPPATTEKKEKNRKKHKWDKKRLAIEVMVNILVALITSICTKEKYAVIYKDNIITYDVYSETVSSIDESNDKISSDITGKEIAEYAMKFLGNPYVYGGSSLTSGADSAGFVKAVYNSFGFVLPHSSEAIRNIGNDIPLAKVELGDIVCYAGHVAIYVGDGNVIHSSTPKSGIKVSNMYYREPLCVKRIISDNL